MAGERKAVDIVQELIQTCREMRQLYRDAAAQLSDPELRAFFSEQSIERGEFASQLEQKIAQALTASEEQGVTSSSSRSIATQQGGDKALLATLEKREALARKNYGAAAQQDLPDDLPEIVAQECEAIKAAHDYLKLMQERMSREQAA